jgi:oxygen-independent coproporphyrinogen-3 oxidase
VSAPGDGRLPASVGDAAGDRALGIYLHVPFCAARCGYCDFTTYTTGELGPDVDPSAFPDAVLAELDLAAGVLDGAGVGGRPAGTVFFGGGTPTVLPAGELLRLLDGVRRRFGLTAGAEVTVEANPESVTRDDLIRLASGGVTRISLGMQSAVSHVLATLERTHDPHSVPRVIRWARDAGLSVSVDLIYGTPGESERDWAHTLDAVLDSGPDHVSAYSLVIEPGTRMGTLLRRGRMAPVDDGDLAAKYELAEHMLTDAGLDWYEVSNWATAPEQRCRHNLGYWRGQDWWGAGPGAHSHVGGVRWWNVRHPREYSRLLGSGLSPAEGREVLDQDARYTERVLLGVRLVDGLPVTELEPRARPAVAALVADGLVAGAEAVRGRVVLTVRGRLLADAVVRALLDPALA